MPGGRFPRGDFAVSAWIKPETAESDGPRCIYVDINGCIVFALDAQGRLTCSRQGTDGWANAVGASRIAPGEWTLVGFAYDRQALRLHVDGRLDGEAACTGERAT